MAVHYIKSVAEVTALIQSWKLENYYVITDHNCETYCVSKIFSHKALSNTQIFSFEPGEINKSLSTFEKGIDFLTEHNASRNSIVINVGGGVTTDLGGFIAACYKRGIHFINIPTSLLAQVDASHGGKVGVNHKHLKNYIGAFKPAKHTIICPEFLSTLPASELKSGFAEMLKHGLIANLNYWHDLKSLDLKKITGPDWLTYIQTSIELKTSIVENDPLEAGERKKLNFGHTVGHAIESLFLGSSYHVHHGVAIAAGMIIEADIANKTIGFPDDALDDIKQHLLYIYGKLPVQHSDIELLFSLMLADKKNSTHAILMSLPSSIGACRIDIPANKDIIKSAIINYIDL